MSFIGFNVGRVRQSACVLPGGLEFRLTISRIYYGAKSINGRPIHFGQFPNKVRLIKETRPRHVGIDGGLQLAAGVSSIAEIDIGLTFIPGDESSSSPNVVSVDAHSGSVLVMTAYAKGPATCFGILSVARTRAHPYFPAYPITAIVGTYYFKGTSSASANCAAAKVDPTALSTTGFPAA